MGLVIERMSVFHPALMFVGTVAAIVFLVAAGFGLAAGIAGVIAVRRGDRALTVYLTLLPVASGPVLVLQALLAEA